MDFHQQECVQNLSTTSLYLSPDIDMLEPERFALSKLPNKPYTREKNSFEFSQIVEIFYK